jgi:hypothetical protein
VAVNGGADARRLFSSILLASASVPGMFPPVPVRFRSVDGAREELHVDGGVTLPFFVAPALQDLPSSGVATQPALVRIIIDGRLRDFPYAAHANAYSIFRRSVSAGLSNLMRSTLEWTVDASRLRGISVEYAAIPPSYPLHGAFDFDPDQQRALFEYAASCAQQGRLWIRAPQLQPLRTMSGHAVEQRPAGTDATCPADDRFVGEFAALATVE